MEIQPKNMTEEEKTLCRKAIADYKTIRPVVQFGDIYRLVSPYDRLGVASLMYTSPEKDKAVFYWWKTEHFVNQFTPCKNERIIPRQEIQSLRTEPDRQRASGLRG